MTLLQAKNINFAYGNRKVLDNVSLSLGKGEVVSLLGPNGSGKSTLLKILLGFHHPHHGEVLLDGEILHRISPKKLAKRIAYVPQIHQIAFPYSVIEVVLMGRMPHQSLFTHYSKCDRQIALEALDKLAISHLQNRAYTEISGGERQLALIARALAQGAKNFIMDEPVSGLDYGNQLRLLERIHQLAQDGYSFLKSTHFPEHALLISDRVILLGNGVIIAEGKPSEVITSENIQRLYGVEVDILPVTDAFTVCVPRFARKEIKDSTLGASPLTAIHHITRTYSVGTSQYGIQS